MPDLHGNGSRPLIQLSLGPGFLIGCRESRKVGFVSPVLLYHAVGVCLAPGFPDWSLPVVNRLVTRTTRRPCTRNYASARTNVQFRPNPANKVSD